MSRKHFEFWPKALPTEIHVPLTQLWENLEIAARRYPDKAAYRVERSPDGGVVETRLEPRRLR